jgi:hypothetical protein
MTVPATLRRAGPFSGTGSSIACPFTFRVFSAADIEVRKATAAGVESVVTSGLTITINADQDATPGGSVSLTAASGETVVIVGATPYSQTLDLPSGGNFSPRAVENALDRTTFQVQQLAEEVGRALALPATATTVDAQLPVPAGNRYLGWNAAGTALVNREGTGAANAEDVTANDGAGGSLFTTVAGFISRLLSSAGAALVGFLQAGAGAVARTLQVKLRESMVSVKDFGAAGDGTTDDTAAFAAAIASLPGGGRIHVPRGWYRITSSLSLHSGLCFYGDGCTNLTFGTPTNAERPSHIFIDSDTGALFTHAMDVQLESVRFFDLSFGARLFPTTVPRGTSTGFSFSGKYPVDAKHATFERCQFSNFGAYAIRVRDPVAPHASNPDWNMAPVDMTACTFYYNAIGIEIEADNADIWTLTNCAWFQSSGHVGVSIRRGGMILLVGCFGGGGTMVKTVGTIRDAITLLGCQFEAATALLHVADTMATQQLYRPIKLISCVIEAPVILGVACHLITEGCRWVDNLEVPVSGCVVESRGDSFLGSTAWNLAAGSVVHHFQNADDQRPTGVRGQIFNGQAIHRTAASPSVSIVGVVGDISWNTAPATGQPPGWVCTAAPSTWRPMASLV